MSLDLAFLRSTGRNSFSRSRVWLQTIVTAALLRLGGKRKAVAAEASLLMSSPPNDPDRADRSGRPGLIGRDTAGFCANRHGDWADADARSPTGPRAARWLGGRWRRHGACCPVGMSHGWFHRFGRAGGVAEMPLPPHLRRRRFQHRSRQGRARRRLFDDLGDASAELLDSSSGSASALILTMDDPCRSSAWSKSAKLAPRPHIVVRARDQDMLRALPRGCHRVRAGDLESSLQLSQAVW